MPTAEIKILCNQIIEEVKLISTGVDDIATLGGGESKVIDRLKAVSYTHLVPQGFFPGQLPDQQEDHQRSDPKVRKEQQRGPGPGVWQLPLSGG